MFAVTQGTSAAAPGGHKAVMINGSMRPSVGEDLAQGGGEGVRLARLAVFAAEESVMAAGEGDGRCPEPFGHGRAARPAARGLVERLVGAPVRLMGWFSACKDPHGNECGLWHTDTPASAPPQ